MEGVQSWRGLGFAISVFLCVGFSASLVGFWYSTHKGPRMCAGEGVERLLVLLF